MLGRLVRFLLVLGFAVAVGHLVWQTYLGPAPVPKYLVGGEVEALYCPNPEAKQLYLRRELYLSRRPLHAWLQVLARDRVRIYVNGRLVIAKTMVGFDVATVVDPSPYLAVGRNIIAILTRQTSVRRPPVVSVTGGYTLEDGNYTLATDGLWRYREVFERKAHWWFETEFDDRHWDYAPRTTCYLRGNVGRPTAVSAALLNPQTWAPQGSPTSEGPPAATITPNRAHWITPALEGSSGTVRGELEVPARPRSAWLRVTATSSYRLAVNGMLLDEEEDQLNTTQPVPPVRRTYDLTSVVRRGRNVVTLALTGTTAVPHVQADLGVEDEAGQRHYLASDGRWTSRPGLPAEWLAETQADPGAWGPCREEPGYLGVMPWEPRRQVIDIVVPSAVRFARAGQQIGLVVAIGVATLLTCWLVGLLLAWLSGGKGAAGVAYLALLPAALGIGAAVLATYDPRIARHEVYRGEWLLAAVLSVPVQWLVLALLARTRQGSLAGASGSDGPSQPEAPQARSASEGTPHQPEAPAPDHKPEAPARGTDQPEAPAKVAEGPTLATCLTGLALLALLAVGFWLRYRDLLTEPLQHDESNHYRMTRGLWKRGCPSFEIHPNLPDKFVETSTLFYITTALSSLVFDDVRLIVRVPALIWATATIVLLYLVGRDLFGRTVGLCAAALYTFAPLCIQMADFGRYLSQTQLLTLLTVYLFWRTIEGTGPINRRLLWLTGLVFLMTYLTWEATSLTAFGMILAVLIHRRGRLRSVLGDPTVWAAMLVVMMVCLIQYSYREMSLSRFLWYGAGGARDTRLMPMWRFPGYEPWYYVWNASWARDTFLPMLGLLGGALLAVRGSSRHAARFLLVIFLTTGVFMASLMSVKQWRYGYHLVPLLLLLASAALVAGVRRLAVLYQGAPRGWRWYGAGVVGLAGLGVLALGSGMPLQLAEMAEYRIPPYLEPLGLDALKFADHNAAVRFLRKNLQDGDVIMANRPHLLDVLMVDRRTDYWPENSPLVPALLDDVRPVPLHYYNGALMVPNRKSFEDVFARHRRVWYVTAPDFHTYTNDAEMSDFLTQNMDVVYEDFLMVVMLRDANHRTSAMRRKNVSALGKARATLWDYSAGAQ
jgi:4-amino-4-deoxy-L-arabinose transferase-like glycosyltransferase